MLLQKLRHIIWGNITIPDNPKSDQHHTKDKSYKQVYNTSKFLPCFHMDKLKEILERSEVVYKHNAYQSPVTGSFSLLELKIITLPAYLCPPI
jgi:hypothetical protein